jgi:1,4-dihydroxy-2-naphthoate octaprenyltransferase
LLANGRFSLAVIPGSLAFFSLAVALLLSHQPPQITTDRQAGKRSFAVRFGARLTRQTARLLYLAFLLSFAVVVWQAGLGNLALTVCGIGAGVSGLLVLQSRPSPRLILAGATLVVLATLLAGLAATKPDSHPATATGTAATRVDTAGI